MRALSLTLALITIGIAAGATGAREDLAYQNRDQITATGVVRLVGSEPFTRVAIRTADGVDLLPPKELGDTLRSLQGRRVTVKGRVRVERMRSADHKYEIVKYHLENAVLVE